jgi:hypothetical protein
MKGSSEYAIKQATVREYQDALKYKKMYEELCESFQCIVTDLLQYAEKNNIVLPNRDRIYRNVEKAEKLIQYRISQCKSPTSLQQPDRTPREGNSTMVVVGPG